MPQACVLFNLRMKYFWCWGILCQMSTSRVTLLAVSVVTKNGHQPGYLFWGNKGLELIMILVNAQQVLYRLSLPQGFLVRLEGKRTQKSYNQVFRAGHGRIIRKSQKPVPKYLSPIWAWTMGNNCHSIFHSNRFLHLYTVSKFTSLSG